jgi:uncharacterized membrane protein YkvI
MKRTLVAIGNFIVNRFDNEHRFLRFVGFITALLIVLILLVTFRLITSRSSSQEQRGMTRSTGIWQKYLLS